MDGSGLPLCSKLVDLGRVVRARGTRRKPWPGYIGSVFGSFADVETESDTHAAQQFAKATQLVFRQRVHRIDDDRTNGLRFSGVAKHQGFADDGIQEAFG